MALFAFSSILETRHHQQLLTTVTQSLEMISNFLCDNNTPDHLKEVSAWTIERICDSYGQDILKDDKNTFGKLIELILSLLPNSKRKVCVNLCNALNSLVKKINCDLTTTTNELSPYCQRIMNILLTLATQNGSYNIEYNVSLGCFFTIGTVAEHSARDVLNVIQSNFKLLAEMYEKTFNTKIFSDNNMRNDYQIYIVTTLCSFVLYSGIPDEDLESLSSKLFDVFTDVQMAWMNFEYDSLRRLCNDTIYNTYYEELEALKLKDGKNIMSDFAKIEDKIINVSSNNDIVTIDYYLDVKFYDYVINTKTNKIEKGNDKYKLHNIYKLTFTKSNKENNTCPNCGAHIESGSTKCSHCKAVIVKDSSEFVLSEKRKIG
jgi:hypothetical protein